MDVKWESTGKGRNSPKSGYYMLLIIATPDVRDHLSDREVSTVLFLPANIRSMAGELPRAHDISGQWISITIQEYSKSSRNFKFREAVQLCAHEGDISAWCKSMPEYATAP